MKYNPKINEEIANWNCFINIHPNQPQKDIQGCLEVFFELGAILKKITGLDAITFQPSAGAHGELCGLFIAKKYFTFKGQKRDTVIIPDSAHGTNFASASMAGFEVLEIKTNKKTGTIDTNELQEIISKKKDSIALIMITNPNTLGVFEKEIIHISDIIHKNGGLLYYDGANLNALAGKVRPGDMGFDIVHLNLHKTFAAPHGGGGPRVYGPVIVRKNLKQFLPVPLVEKKKKKYYLEYNLENSIGRMKSFYGNFSVIIKSYCYLLSMGSEIKAVAEHAVLNANYLKTKLQECFEIPYHKNTMHEFVISLKNQKKTGANALNISKRIIDYGVYPPTIYFPVIVEEAMMIEPTETESLFQGLINMPDLKKILIEAEKDIDILNSAPHNAPAGRIDELKALKEPVLKE